MRIVIQGSNDAGKTWTELTNPTSLKSFDRIQASLTYPQTGIVQLSKVDMPQWVWEKLRV